MSYANSGPPLAGGCGPHGSSNRISFFYATFCAVKRLRQKTPRNWLTHVDYR